MNHIRSWIVRVVFGKAQSEAPAGVDQQMREEHPGWAFCNKHDWHLRDECVECAYEVEGQ